ncbi:hypothetical protein K438DRAFT_760135 [Mycena galopus ATCC 62051]|nr:hypothetical protein K438DRAFT_760135 [Mycena galopus ATCC 62051]
MKRLAFVSSKVCRAVYSVYELTMAGIDAAVLRETQTQLRATEARLQDADDEERPVTRARDDPINIPSRLTDVTMGEIRGHLGYDKPKWRALRSCVRDSLRAARLNWDLDWKSQSTTKRGYAYNAVEDDFPELRRFVGQWAVDRIAKDVWDNHKTYINCVDNPSTYIGRRAAQRQGASPSSRHPSSPARAPTSPQQSSRDTPTPGPSQRPVRTHRRLLVRSPSTSSSSGDDLLDFPDTDHPNDEEDEEVEDLNGMGKRRTRPSGGSSPKRRKM